MALSSSPRSVRICALRWLLVALLSGWNSGVPAVLALRITLTPHLDTSIPSSDYCYHPARRCGRGTGFHAGAMIPSMRYSRYRLHRAGGSRAGGRVIARIESGRSVVGATTGPATTTSIFSAGNDDADETDDDDGSRPRSDSLEVSLSRLMVVIPFLSLGFPPLLDAARGSSGGTWEQFAAIAALVGSSRIYLYLMAATVVALAAVRGVRDDVRLGQRVVGLTEEMIFNPPLPEAGDGPELSEEGRRTFAEAEGGGDEGGEGKESSATAAAAETFKRPAVIRSLSGGLGDSLDEVSTETQAVALPVLVSALLASSVLLLQFAGGGGGSSSTNAVLNDLLATAAAYLPIIGGVWTAALLTLFARCEVRRLCFRLDAPLFTNDGDHGGGREWIPWLVASSITAAAYLGAWPAQNFVNMSLALLVARAVQIGRFPAVAAALGFLTLYDAASVLLIKPAVAATAAALAVVDPALPMADGDLSAPLLVAAAAAGEAAPTAASSAMGAVAMDRLLSGGFRPGLLVTVVGEGRVSGALGLGDAVFPSILATFAARYDDGHRTLGGTDEGDDGDASSSPSKGKILPVSLFGASIGGYVVGCLACEFVPFVSTTGVPALLLIAPSMLISVVAAASFRGELGELWRFDPEENVAGNDRTE